MSLIQTLTETPAKFLKDQANIVGGVAFTRYLVFICFGRSQEK